MLRQVNTIHQEKFIILIFASLLGLFYLWPCLLSFVILWCLYIGLLIIKRENALFLLVLIHPFIRCIRTQVAILSGVNPLLWFVAPLFILIAIDYFIFKKTRAKIHLETALFCMLFFLMFIIALLLNFADITLKVSYYSSLALAMALFALFTSFALSNKRLYDLLLFTLVTGSLLMATIMLPSVVTAIASGSRLKFYDSINALTDLIGPASVVMGYFLLYREKDKLLPDNRYLTAILLVVFAVLLLTGSRGTVYSVLLSWLVIFIYTAKQKLSWRYVIVSLVAVTLVACMLAIGLFPEQIQRLVSTDDIRMEIWKNAFAQVSTKQLVFGLGLNRFQELSRQGGYVASYSGKAFYAHSLYLDILFSAGIFAVLLFLAYVACVIRTCVKNKSLLGIALAVYLLSTVLTHGQSISISFWLTLSYVWGASKWYGRVGSNQMNI